MKNYRKASCHRAAVLLAAATAGICATQSLAAALPNGVIVTRIGGSSAFGAGSTAGDTTTQLPMYLDDFSLTGTPASPQFTLSLNDTTGGNHAMTTTASGAGGTPFAEGGLDLSPNGQYLTVAGYDTATSSSSRVIGSVDVTTGALNTQLTLNSAVGFRSVVTTDTTGFWYLGSSNGFRYATLNSPPTSPYTGSLVTISPTNMNQRNVAIYGGQLFIDGASSVATPPGGNPGIAVFGTGTPNSGTSTQAFIMTTTSNPAEFVMLDQNSNGYTNGSVATGLDTTYVATDAGVEKWMYSDASSTWTRSYILSSGLGSSSKITTSMVGVAFAGKDASGNNILYGTTSGNLSNTSSPEGNALMELVDTGSSASWQLITTSPDDTWFRGVEVVKTKIPGDENGDGTVDLTDYNDVLNNFGNSYAPSTGIGDENGDGTVDLTDYNDVLNNFGNSAAPGGPSISLVPEPASLLVMLPLAIPMISRRRRR